MTKISNYPTEPHVPASPALLSWVLRGPDFPLIPIHQATRSERLALLIYA